MKGHVAVVLAVAAGLTSSAGAQAPAGGPGFGDDFRADNRASYESQGKLTWEPGRLGLPEKALIARRVKGGDDIEVAAVLLRTAGDRGATRLGFFVNSDLVNVVIDRTREPGEVRIEFSTKEAAGKAVRRVLGDGPIPPGETAGEWVVRSRRGLVRVSLGGRRVAQGFTGEIVAQLTAVFLAQDVGAGTVRRFAVACSPRVGPVDQARLDELKRLRGAAGKAALSRRFEEAYPLARQGLELCSTLYGPRHELTINSALFVATIEDQLGDKAGAKARAELTLAATVEVYGPEHPRTAETLLNVGDLAMNRSDFGACRSAYTAALEAVRATLGDDVPQAADVLDKLARLEERLDRYDAERPCASDRWPSAGRPRGRTRRDGQRPGRARRARPQAVASRGRPGPLRGDRGDSQGRPWALSTLIRPAPRAGWAPSSSPDTSSRVHGPASRRRCGSASSSPATTPTRSPSRITTWGTSTGRSATTAPRGPTTTGCSRSASRHSVPTTIRPRAPTTASASCWVWTCADTTRRCPTSTRPCGPTAPASARTTP